ncbi:MAG: hypothetical protein EBR82_19395 [Caulobacteraceae bacterium]|nr:hypothetical protein [Caulobacteraceae bacterium]
MNLLKRLVSAPWRRRSILDEVRDLEGRDLTPEMRDAIAQVMDRLSPELSGSRLRSLRPAIVLAFARQAADGARRLKSDHWRSGAGENVGHEVLRANARALEAVRAVLATNPSKRRAPALILQALDRVTEAQRDSTTDGDGYGLATLHELRREIERLGPRPTVLETPPQERRGSSMTGSDTSSVRRGDP